MLLAAGYAPSYARSSVTTSATRAPAPRRHPAPVSSPFRFGFVAKRAELGFISTVATFGTAVEITITVGTAWILLQAGVVALFAAALQTAIRLEPSTAHPRPSRALRCPGAFELRRSRRRVRLHGRRGR